MSRKPSPPPTADLVNRQRPVLSRGRLPFEFTDEKLEALFTPIGKVVSAKMTPDPKNKRSRGFGFVVMGSNAEARAAIEKLNKTMVGEKDIWVTEARPKSAPATYRRR